MRLAAEGRERTRHLSVARTSVAWPPALAAASAHLRCRRARAPPALRAAPFDELPAGHEQRRRGRGTDIRHKAVAVLELVGSRGRKNSDADGRARSPTSRTRPSQDPAPRRRVCRRALRTAARAPASRIAQTALVPGARAAVAGATHASAPSRQEPVARPIRTPASRCRPARPAPSGHLADARRAPPRNPPSAARHRSPPRSS